MDHSSHGGGESAGNPCKISMLWNWNTVDTCFISSSWQVTSRGMFAGSCIGVILLVMSLEFLRRVGHEYDRYLAGQRHVLSSKLGASSPPSKKNASTSITVSGPSLLNDEGQPQGPYVAPRRRRSLLQHTVRSLLHMVQFGVAYFVMLLAMYYNGYFIICILIGSFLGYFAFSWQSGEKDDACSTTVCCG